MGNMHVAYSKHKISSKKHCPTFIKELCHQFSLEDLKKSTNNFDEARKLGQSLYRIVYKGYLKHNGENEYPVAVERMTHRLGDWMFKKLIELHSQLHHPNLISLIGICDQKDEKIIVYEYMFNGSLYDHLRSRDLESLSWKKRLEICIGVARGLHYLHTGAKRTIFHCDIKPQAILLDNQMVPKLAQLGISLQEKRSKSKPTMIKLDTDELHNIIGSTGHGYMAPECVRTNTFTDKCDVYSFGMVLLEVEGTNYKNTIFDKMVKLGNTDWFLEKLSNPANILERLPTDEIIDPILMRLIAPQCLEVFMDIMKRCFNIEPNERPTIGEVEVELEHALALQEEADCGKSRGTTGHGYTTPECVRTNTFSDKCDVYSFGMVLLDVACTNKKYTILDKMKMFMYKIEFLEEDIINAVSFFEKFIDAEIMDIMKIRLNIEPNEKPTMGDVEVEYNS